ncbi:xanthine dehydrogenase molybdenum-binding subunit XdhA [Ruminococcaceae bacterium OttesenSCG-928-A16]|nr:xanthine dehydrogenase molybdenum-binding subunit XdhA [Ruminococcaceae bacterium OttesenSCG-928-A16]
MGIRTNLKRVDAYEKVTGRALYTDDMAAPGMLVAKVVRSTIANGIVKRFDTTEAEKVPGVVKILTCFDSPDFEFPTAGHPWSVEPAHQDVADRKLLNTRVRVYGDDIGAVIAEDEVAATRAARLIKVEYEEFTPITTIEAALASTEVPIHEAYPDNILNHTHYTLGEVSVQDVFDEPGLQVYQGEYDTQVVQHCHIEVPVSYAYMEKDRIVVVSSTQIPHIVRRVCGQAMGIPFGKIRVIKPYIGGGFGNKQEVLYEPLNAWLTTQVGGRPVKLELSREETLACTRTRHAMHFNLKTAVDANGRLMARKMVAHSNQGGYASHGHAIISNAANAFRMMYQDEKALEQDATTVYTNISSGGAMRGYGIPQMMFGIEAHMDDIAKNLGIDPIDIRKLNCMKPGFVDPGTGITCHTSGLLECIEKGREFIGWDQKRAAYQNQTGPLRRGVGMSIFCYKTGVYPISLETASCRIVLNQDGSVQLQMGATEIGQGADTVFTQMAAESIGLAEANVHIISTQDTDVTPFDTGAYASRQTYVSGMALKQTAEIFKTKVLNYAAEMLSCPAAELDIVNGNIVEKANNKHLLTMEQVGLESFYSLTHSVHITAESTYHCKNNTFSFGVSFAEVEVDIPVGKINVLNIINVHDSGVLINPQLAQAQVHGGMSMGLGYALGEQLLFNNQGRALNDNLLDYKLPTAMDTPELHVDFVETVDPTGPYGNKSLGEPPTIPTAPTLRNAVLHATGVAINSLPLNPQKLVEEFTKAGLIEKGGELDV